MLKWTTNRDLRNKPRNASPRTDARIFRHTRHAGQPGYSGERNHTGTTPPAECKRAHDMNALFLVIVRPGCRHIQTPTKILMQGHHNPACGEGRAHLSKRGSAAMFKVLAADDLFPLDARCCCCLDLRAPAGLKLKPSTSGDTSNARSATNSVRPDFPMFLSGRTAERSGCATRGLSLSLRAAVTGVQQGSRSSTRVCQLQRERSKEPAGGRGWQHHPGMLPFFRRYSHACQLYADRPTDRASVHVPADCRLL